MSHAAIAAGVTVLVTAALTVMAVRLNPGWTERGITALGGWPRTHALQASAAGVTGPLIAVHWGTPAGVAAAAMAWLGTLAVLTDVRCRKVPWEIPHPVALIGLACFAAHPTSGGGLSMAAITVGLVGVPWLARVLTNAGLGMSDIRLLWAVTATLSWWVAPALLLWALIAACLIQLLVRAAAVPFGWGEKTPVPARRPHPTPAGDMATVTVAVAPGTVRLRRELPFAPALTLAFAGAVIVATSTGYSACITWAVTTTCP